MRQAVVYNPLFGAGVVLPIFSNSLSYRWVSWGFASVEKVERCRQLLVKYVHLPQMAVQHGALAVARTTRCTFFAMAKTILNIVATNIGLIIYQWRQHPRWNFPKQTCSLLLKIVRKTVIFTGRQFSRCNEKIMSFVVFSRARGPISTSP